MARRKTAELKMIGGSISDDLNSALVNQAAQTIWLSHCKPDDRTTKLHTVVDTMVGIAPENEIEGMLAAQMVAVHHATMECFRRAMIEGQSFEGRAQNLAFGNKLANTYTRQMEALQKNRGKGQQQMTVIHQHVQVAGGKVAVAGVANSPAPDGRGDGQSEKSEEQPHAKQIDRQPVTPMPPLSCEDTAQESVPVSRHGKRAV